MHESAFKILNTIDNPMHVYLAIVFDPIVRFLSLLKENHRQLECYHRQYLLIAPNKGAFIEELFKFYSQKTLLGVPKDCRKIAVIASLHQDTTKITSMKVYTTTPQR